MGRYVTCSSCRYGVGNAHRRRGRHAGRRSRGPARRPRHRVVRARQRQQPRELHNRFVARQLYETGIGTLLFDLLTPEEESDPRRELRFAIGLLARRLLGATAWLTRQRETAALRIGYFGASTGAAAALVAAARGRVHVGAIVSRGGRPDLAGKVLPAVKAPTLLIVGERDTDVLALNEEAYAQLRYAKALQTVPGATHLFGEPGALVRVADLAAAWFGHHLGRADPVEHSALEGAP